MVHSVEKNSDKSRTANNFKENKRRFQEASFLAKLAEERLAKHSIEDVLNLLAKVNLDTPEAQKIVENIHKNYQADEFTFFFATLLLFAKKHVLTPESFSFIKSSMNMIEHVFNFFNKLFGEGLLTRLNLGTFFNLPVLKNINALFSVISKEEKTDLSQERFDEHMAGAEPMSKTFVESLSEDPRLKSMASSLFTAAKEGIKSEVALEAIKAHPAPQSIAKALIELKNKGIKLTQTVLDKLSESDDPHTLVDSLVELLGKEIPKTSDISSVSSFMTYATKKACSGMGAMFGLFKPAPSLGKTKNESVHHPEVYKESAGKEAPLVIDELDNEEVTSITI